MFAVLIFENNSNFRGQTNRLVLSNLHLDQMTELSPITTNSCPLKCLAGRMNEIAMYVHVCPCMSMAGM